MTASLLLLFRGPMQSWGDESRFSVRATGPHPTKSGVIGLVAAALGRRRTDPIEDLARLRFAVRIDQSGSLLRDYQTAQPWQTRPEANARLITRHFLSDAVFVAAVESEDRDLLEQIAAAVRSPRFPLFLGRRSCPANPDLLIGVRDTDAVSALRAEPWHVSETYRRLQPPEIELPILRDGTHEEEGILRRDVPLSFSQDNREYGWRTVVREEHGAVVANGTTETSAADPFFGAVISA
ncbi:type I-E CRISPR-associated protein Cas5/CasD [Brachybacterium nesterenkovii]|uniref:CRISPR-associated protein, Cas5e family n=1 Tax=Brachybacterium nesterenkovii TaxID=47847 RepID=A0A1X6WX61_9MICO|nr:type I-E CRISPR-associated protein Cas5/CasD [Brachybacterium nesterenkovii]SLM90299.1 CRISPR-associated protein, Cas5e family [Brachybacterium nesterenkovii]